MEMRGTGIALFLTLMLLMTLMAICSLLLAPYLVYQGLRGGFSRVRLPWARRPRQLPRAAGPLVSI